MKMILCTLIIRYKFSALIEMNSLLLNVTREEWKERRSERYFNVELSHFTVVIEVYCLMLEFFISLKAYPWRKFLHDISWRKNKYLEDIVKP